MTSYIAITNSEVQPEAPITSELMTKLRDNPLSIAEGDSSAPSLLPAIANKSAAGGIGTYVFANSTTTSDDVGFGSTRAGSALRPTSAVTAITVTGDETLTNGFALNSGSALSGTWRCMGAYDYVTRSSVGRETQSTFGATLWLRIS